MSNAQNYHSAWRHIDRLLNNERRSGDGLAQDQLHGRHDRAWGTHKIPYHLDGGLQSRK
jgi:hypothetical protein